MIALTPQSILFTNVKIHLGEISRPVIGVKNEMGETSYREFDILKSFSSEQEAMKYASDQGVSLLNQNHLD